MPYPERKAIKIDVVVCENINNMYIIAAATLYKTSIYFIMYRT